MCAYGTRRPLTARLRHCDNGVNPGTELFHFVAADDCRCKVIFYLTLNLHSIRLRNFERYIFMLKRNEAINILKYV